MKLLPLLPLIGMFGHAIAATPLSQAEACVRQGDHVQALALLQQDSGVEAAFWKGHALHALGRTQAAIAEFSKVPAEHKLYVYAAKALLMSAWQSPGVDFATVATPLTTSSHAEIADLATAALAEYWLNTPQSQDNTALELLKSRCSQNADLAQVLRLLNIRNDRRKGDIAEGVKKCREMIQDTSIPLIMRQRARLELSEFYYACEESGHRHVHHDVAHHEQMAADDEDEDEKDDSSDMLHVDGQGEEVLLHFISTNPSSTLLHEAFRRLVQRKAFLNSEQARSKLDEWAKDLEHTGRASLALLIQQRLLNVDSAADAPIDVSCANTAVSACPNEQATQTILMEQVRQLILRGKNQEAELYLNMAKQHDARHRFYTAVLQGSTNPAVAAQAFLSCAEQAPDDLQSAAFVNALLCALAAQEPVLEQAVWSHRDIDADIKAELLAGRAAFLLESSPEQADKDLDELDKMQLSSQMAADVILDRTLLQLRTRDKAAAETIAKVDPATLSPTSQLRYYTLMEEVMRQNGAGDHPEVREAAIIDMISKAAKQSKDTYVHSILTLHLANLQSQQDNHTAAYKTLQNFMEQYPKGDYFLRAMYLAARESELMATEESLKRAIELYNLCSKAESPLAARARIHKASILTRVGQFEEAQIILNGLLDKPKAINNIETALANIVLANTYAMKGTQESFQKAVEVSARMRDDASLPRYWRFLVILHHGVICARADLPEAALRDFIELLDMQPAKGENPGIAEWRALYTAAAGGISQLLLLGRHEEAAQLSERIANWNPAADAVRVRQYRAWAKHIRQTYFLPEPNQQ